MWTLKGVGVVVGLWQRELRGSVGRVGVSLAGDGLWLAVVGNEEQLHGV